MTPLTHVSSMDRFLEALESLDTAKTSPFGYSFGEVLFLEQTLADRTATLRNTVLLYAFRFLSR
jgi:hypothetical protein